MKSLIKNYIDTLTIDKLKNFALKNDINLSNEELNYLFNLIKTEWDKILIDDKFYLVELEKNMNRDNYLKIKELYFYYKNRYKGYLF